MTINEIQDEVISEFEGFDDWMDKYQLLIDLGSEQEPLEEKYKTEQNLIDGCQSRVWVQCDKEDDGTLTYLCDVPGSGSFAVDGERLYTTANMNAGGGNSADNDPTTLYVTTLGDAPTTTTYHMNFEIVRCQLQIDSNDLIATNGDEQHVIALNALEAFEAMQ